MSGMEEKSSTAKYVAAVLLCTALSRQRDGDGGSLEENFLS